MPELISLKIVNKQPILISIRVYHDETKIKRLKQWLIIYFLCTFLGFINSIWKINRFFFWTFDNVDWRWRLMLTSKRHDIAYLTSFAFLFRKIKAWKFWFRVYLYLWYKKQYSKVVIWKEENLNKATDTSLCRQVLCAVRFSRTIEEKN